eukprot:TRINITY_DN2878_c0_g1_i2.p1 TRINITY_DN2878_c0_g1~~TRINITY_DN2878_c0_g1_i2.p1  ORF type:complete len:134 (+),score=21.10 TRINITY_DN2878_c0_g1_i2:46-447(+)
MASNNINILGLDVSPNQCPIDQELKLEIDFSNDSEIKDGSWSVKYIVDSAYKRHVVDLGKTTGLNYPAGNHHYSFSVAHIDVTGVKPHMLLNVGLLSVSFKDGENDLVEINMVTQVTKDADGGFIRTIFNPLE